MESTHSEKLSIVSIISKLNVKCNASTIGDNSNINHKDLSTMMNESLDRKLESAKTASDAEHEMPLLEGIKQYPKAVCWSLVLSSIIIMEGYDTVLLSSFYTLEPFKRKFGELTNLEENEYQIPARWQTGLSMCVNVGEIIGLFFSGYIADKIGYKKTLLISLFLTVCFIFIVFFADKIGMIAVGELLLGLPWGAFQTLSVSYACEVCPIVLRNYLTTYVNLCWVIGQLIGSGVLKGTVNMESDWSYRIPFAIQWIWPVPIMISIYFAPESPWWLVKTNNLEEARISLNRLRTKPKYRSREDHEKYIDNSLSMIVITTDLEEKECKGATYYDCFKGINLRRTEITSCVWIIQQMCGGNLMGYSNYFYVQAGNLSENDSFSLSLGQYGVGIVGTLLSWYLMRTIGRRTLYIWGIGGLFLILIIIGGLGCLPTTNKGVNWGIGSLLLVLTFVYDMTIGPVCYSLVPELSSSRLRTKTVVIARDLFNVFAIINSFLTPYMLNPTAWNWGAKTGFFWAGLNSICFIYAYFRLPEPKGRSFAELDLLFEKKIPARKFAETEVNPFDLHVNNGDQC